MINYRQKFVWFLAPSIFNLVISQNSTRTVRQSSLNSNNLKTQLDCSLKNEYDPQFFNSVVKLCDGVENCFDGSDELCDQPLYPCDESTIVLSQNELNLKGIYVCNGKQECLNKMDEIGCYYWTNWSKWRLTEQVTEETMNSDNCYAVRERSCKMSETVADVNNHNCRLFIKDPELAFEDMSYDKIMVKEDSSQEAVKCLDFKNWLDTKARQAENQIFNLENENSDASNPGSNDSNQNLNGNYNPNQNSWQNNNWTPATWNNFQGPEQDPEYWSPGLIFGIVGGVIGLIVLGVIIFALYRYEVCCQRQKYYV